MRIPRDMNGAELAKRLGRFGYVVTRQAGSHMRLTTQRAGEHHVTIPAHKPVRLGTFHSVVADVSGHLGMTRDQLLAELLA